MSKFDFIKAYKVSGLKTYDYDWYCEFVLNGFQMEINIFARKVNISAVNDDEKLYIWYDRKIPLYDCFKLFLEVLEHC